MEPDILFFFDKHPGALPLYQTWESRILAEVEHVTVKVQKTQITFANRRQFACVSFLPARRAKDRPEDYITVTLGLNRRLDSPTICSSPPRRRSTASSWAGPGRPPPLRRASGEIFYLLFFCEQKKQKKKL